MKDILNNK